MRNLPKVLIVTLYILTTLFYSSCSDKNDTQIKDPEEEKEETEKPPVYLNKVESIKYFSGIEKVKLTWQQTYDPKIQSTIIYWNMRRDSVIKEYNSISNGIEKDSIVINNLNEGVYTFEFKNVNDKNEYSIYSKTTAVVWGDKFYNSLSSREVTKVNYDRNKYILSLDLSSSSKNDNLLYSQIEYKNKEGAENILTIHRDSNTVILSDIPYGDTLRINSVFFFPQGFDTIYSEYSTFIAKPENLILVCGSSRVHIVDYYKSNDSESEIIWTWDAHLSKDLPPEYINSKFNHVADCKAINNGDKIMVCSSSGAIAIINIEDKAVEFYADVPQAHSIELLPNNKIVAAASTHTDGNKLMVFDIDNSNELQFSDSLYSAHGVVWDEKRNSLFALGYDVLREYKIENEIKLVLKEEWKIPGRGGHDLLLAPNGDNLYLTESTGAWTFDIQRKQFSKINQFPDAKNIKSIGENRLGQFIYTLPEESWWTFHVSFHNPKSKIPFNDMRVYKARWFEY